MRKTRRKRKKRTGSFLLALALAVAGAGSAAGQEKKKAAAGPAAVLAGTVFKDAGFAMRGAEVVAATQPPAKKQEWKAVTDGRGEFFLRLPAGPASYNVVVTAAGYRRQEKAVTFAAEERIDLTFLLESGEGKQ